MNDQHISPVAGLATPELIEGRKFVGRGFGKHSKQSANKTKRSKGKKFTFGGRKKVMW